MAIPATKVRKVGGVENVDIDTLRNKWTLYLDDAADDKQEFAVTFRGHAPDAVLMSYDSWEYSRKEGARRDSVLAVDESQYVTLSSDQARAQLRDRREAARRGHHTVITRYRKPVAALAPLEWFEAVQKLLKAGASGSNTAGQS